MTAKRGADPSASAGVVARVASAWRDPAAAFAAERPAPEPRLLAFAFGASLFITMGRMAAEIARPEGMIAAAEQGIGPTGWFAVQVFAGLSFLPLALYAAAALIGLICRIFGGTGGWADTRLAFFWSGFAAGPPAVLAYILGGAIGGAALAGALGGALWLWLLAPMLAAAHGFAASRVVAVFVCLVIAAFAIRALG
ncbi:MAG: hypothetical protein AAF360_19930 [Pseudomonadota bacterium]